MKRRHSWRGAPIAAIAATLASPAWADEATAEALYQEGQRLTQKGQHAEACGKYEEAQRLAPNVTRLLGLAGCREAEGRLATSWALYAKAANEARRDRDHDREQYARDKAAALEPRLPRLHLTLERAEERHGVEVSIDGEVMSGAALGLPLPVDPGEHLVTARQHGYQTWSQPVDVSELGTTKSVVIPLLAPEGSGPPPPAGAMAASSVAAEEEDEGDEEPPASPTEAADARRRWRAAVQVGLGGYALARPDTRTESGPFTFVAGGVQKHFLERLGFTVRGAIGYELVAISELETPEGGSFVTGAVSFLADGALLVGPFGPFAFGGGPWLGVRLYVDENPQVRLPSGTVRTEPLAGTTFGGGAQLVGLFYLGRRGQFQVGGRGQVGVWDDDLVVRILGEFGFAFP